MGDPVSKVIRAEEALPGRTKPIPVAGKTARLLSMRVEPAHSALPEEDVRGRGWVPGRGLRVREEAARPPSPVRPSPTAPPPSPGGAGAQRDSLLPASFSLFEPPSEKKSSIGIDPARLQVCSSVFGGSKSMVGAQP